MENAHIVAPATIAWLGVALGFVFGAVAHRTNFCTMGAIADIVNMGAWARMRSWLFAIAVAVLLTGALQLTGQVDISKSIFTGPKVGWLSAVVGGVLFGIGMTLAGGCGGKTLIRLGAGNLRGLVVFVFVGIAAYMTLKGLFGVWRAAWLDPVALDLGVPQDLPSLLAHWFGMERRQVLIGLTALIGLGLGGFCLAGREFRKPLPLLAGLLIGLVVAGGWYVTGHVGYVAEHPETLQEAFIGTNSGRAESLSFIGPYAYLTELLLMWSDKTRIVTFGIAVILGVVLGAAVNALAMGRFRVEGFSSTDDLSRHLIGAVLMGFGGVTALGCTIGQGITGVSTLSLGSLITLAAIVTGCAMTVKWEYWRAMRE
jgi:hypothetical protein